MIEKDKTIVGDPPTTVSAKDIELNYYTASDVLLISNDAVKTMTIPIGWSKAKEILLKFSSVTPSTLRIKFDLRTTGVSAGNVSGRIYRNGAAVGTTQTTSSTSFTTYSEDISGWRGNDTLELWVERTDGSYPEVQNFRVYGTGTKEKQAEFINTIT
jgi:hypothetical protein